VKLDKCALLPHSCDMAEPLFEILAPAQWNVPAVFNSPHSGAVIPTSLLQRSQLSALALRQSEDCFVDELFLGCQQHGMPMLRALASRAYLDLNREPYELDSRMFQESLPGFMNPGSPRVAAGFGTVPRLVMEGQEIYRGKLALADAMTRIDTYYRPYHRTLNALLNQAHAATGQVLLVDCHSMPASAVRGQGQAFSSKVDMVIGDRHGVSCGRDYANAIHDFFTAQGLHAVRNKPYAGGFITESYGAPQQNRHAIQIELNRELYMDERRQEKTTDFTQVQTILTNFAGFVQSLMRETDLKLQYPLAAE
jgi:N-formylglutamate amidohydrolase